MDNEKERLERKHQLERDVADAILALARGKGVQIRRRACGKTLIGVGYTEVEKCKAAAAGSACVTDDEIARAEAEEKRLKR